MTEALLVLRKLSILREHAGRIERRRGDSREAFATDVDRQDATALSLLVAAQEVVDIAMHVVADSGWSLPDSSGDAIDVLARHDVITVEVARAVRSVVRVRKRVAHGYAGVDATRLWDELPAGLVALEAFATAIAAFVGGE